MKAETSNGKISQEEIYRRLLAGIDEAFRRSETPEGREAAHEAYDYARQIINEHAALVAVAEAAEKLSIQLRRELEDEGEEAALITVLANLAAIRAGSEVAK